MAEAAAYFRCTPRQVARWVAEGRLGAVPIPNGQKRIRGSDVREALDIVDAVTKGRGRGR
jgi:excisionase family DNA binding protein